jgi:hypothetical protein
MLNQATKVVRCLVRKFPGDDSVTEIRFIPYTEFELWKYLMTTQYRFDVSREEIHLYLPREEYERNEAVFSRLPRFEVVKITLYFFLKEDQVLVPVVRYFPSADYARIKPVYLKHYRAFEDRNHAAKVLEEIEEEQGVCLRNLPPGAEQER